ncbi:MAG: DEAD/DEAH box helicase [Syntrophales bacterium]|nr:DEAD/DEAH box helicase [Syntrophales bacterium]MDD5234498.1 DEAD/DEAH box helicase [Syntrophales bacterium]
MDFKSFDLTPEIESGVEDMGYTEPTEIQVQAIPHIMQGRDVTGLAQTGTGKTAAFVLPILRRLKRSGKPVRVLVIAPTRELAEQIHEAFQGLGRHTGLKSVAVYGGVDRKAQIRRVREGADIVVACPGRLLDLMEQSIIKLARVEVLVIDEADRMFDMGFLPDVRRIIKRVPPQRQTLLFSATMPDDVRALAGEILNDPVNIRVGAPVPVSTVSHAIYTVEDHLKTPLLIKLLKSEEMESVLVFTRTKIRATHLASRMKRAGFPVALLQGDLSQNRREEALNGFRNGKYRILVATEIAARGIDVLGISHVINYDMPDNVDAYTHRIGRTGRALRTGIALSFVTRDERAFVWDIEKALGKEMERRILEDFNYGAPPPSARAKPLRQERRGNRGKSLANFPG